MGPITGLEMVANRKIPVSAENKILVKFKSVLH
jgi:hypothetical protein